MRSKRRLVLQSTLSKIYFIVNLFLTIIQYGFSRNSHGKSISLIWNIIEFIFCSKCSIEQWTGIKKVILWIELSSMWFRNRSVLPAMARSTPSRLKTMTHRSHLFIKKPDKLWVHSRNFLFIPIKRENMRYASNLKFIEKSQQTSKNFEFFPL